MTCTVAPAMLDSQHHQLINLYLRRPRQVCPIADSHPALEAQPTKSGSASADRSARHRRATDVLATAQEKAATSHRRRNHSSCCFVLLPNFLWARNAWPLWPNWQQQLILCDTPHLQHVACLRQPHGTKRTCPAGGCFKW